jgi:hypothetical protein
MCFIYKVDVCLTIINSLILMLLTILLPLFFVAFWKLLNLYWFVAMSILCNPFQRLPKSRSCIRELKMLILMFIVLISNRIWRRKKTLNLIICNLFLSTKSFRELSTSSISRRSLNSTLFEPVVSCLFRNIMLSSKRLDTARLWVVGFEKSSFFSESASLCFKALFWVVGGLILLNWSKQSV